MIDLNHTADPYKRRAMLNDRSWAVHRDMNEISQYPVKVSELLALFAVSGLHVQWVGNKLQAVINDTGKQVDFMFIIDDSYVWSDHWCVLAALLHDALHEMNKA